MKKIEVFSSEQLRYALEADAHYNEAMKTNPDAYINPHIDVYVPLDYQGNWAYDYYNIDKLKELGGKLKRKVLVIIVDTAGVFDHPALTKGVRNDLAYVATGEPPRDGYGHGTGCASNVIGIHPDDPSNIKMGIGPVDEGFVEVVPIKGLRNNGSGYGAELADATSKAYELVKEYTAKGYAVIVSNSWGGGGSISEVESLSKKIVEAGGFYIAAAGNSGYKEGTSTVSFPGKYEWGMAIGSIDNNESPSSFSSAGPELDYTAPGRSTYGAWKDGSYLTWSGTSSATPHQAAVMSWILAMFPEITSQTQLYDFLKKHAKDLFNQGFDVRTGHGVTYPLDYTDEIPDDGGDDPDPDPDPDPTPEDPVRGFTSTYNVYVPKNFNIPWQVANSDQKNVATIQLEVEYESDKYFKDAYDEAIMAVDAHFSNRGYVLRETDDVWTLAYWLDYFYQMITLKQGIRTRIRKMYVETENADYSYEVEYPKATIKPSMDTLDVKPMTYIV